MLFDLAIQWESFSETFWKLEIAGLLDLAFRKLKALAKNEPHQASAILCAVHGAASIHMSENQHLTFSLPSATVTALYLSTTAYHRSKPPGGTR